MALKYRRTKTQIYEWFKDIAQKDKPRLNAFCEAILNGEAENVEKQFNAYLSKMISIRDTNVRKKMKENFYHGILLGLLSHREDWDIKSNAESGEGYSDILVEAEDAGVGIIIEVKYAENDRLDEECKDAMCQIHEKKYESVLLDHGIQKIVKFGIACYRKHCRVVVDKGIGK